MSDHFLRDRLRDGKSRRDYAVVAANITEDRYGAGSSAALATIYLMLTHGLTVAEEFTEDLKHHEGF